MVQIRAVRRAVQETRTVAVPTGLALRSAPEVPGEAACNRREFIGACASGLLAISGTLLLEGCATTYSVQSWRPPFECRYLADMHSKLQIVYIPEIHVDSTQAKTIAFIKSYAGKERVDLLALEGFSGKVDQGRMASIRASEELLSKISLSRDQVAKELERYGNHFTPLRLLARMCATEPNFQDGILVYAPGKRYALEFFGLYPMFGYEDDKVLEQEGNLIRLHSQDELYSFYRDHFRGENKEVDALLEAKLGIGGYAKSGEELRRRYGVDPEDQKSFEREFDAFTVRRTGIAIGNIVRQRSSGTIWLVMGARHEESIIREAAARRISLCIPKALPYF